MSANSGSLLIKLGLVLVVLAGGAFAFLSTLGDPAFVAEVTRGKASHAVPGSVTVFADKDLQELKSEVAGRVVWVSRSLNTGESFAKGDPLVRLDATELKRKIEDARRNHEAAVEKRDILRKSNPERQVAAQRLANAERLLQRGDVSEEDVKQLQRALDQIDTSLKIADLEANNSAEEFKSQMNALNDLLAKMTIVAPADGLTQSVMVAEGGLINGGATVATFYHNERIVVAKIGEESFGHIRLGQPAKVRLLIYTDQEFDAKVSKILPFAESQTQLYTIHLEVDMDPKKLLPNSTGEVTITVGERENQPLVPRRALINNDHVLVVKNGRVEKRLVEVGFLGLNLAEIRKGLQPGELVIVENLEQFRDGQRVQARRES